MHVLSSNSANEVNIDYRDHILTLSSAHALSEVLLSKSLKIMAQDCEMFKNNGYTGERVFSDSYKFLQLQEPKEEGSDSEPASSMAQSNVFTKSKYYKGKAGHS